MKIVQLRRQKLLTSDHLQHLSEETQKRLEALEQKGGGWPVGRDTYSGSEIAALGKRPPHWPFAIFSEG